MNAALASIRIVLVATSHPGNIGGAARAMLTMGLKRLLLVNPRSFPDGVAVARAAGASAVLEQARIVAALDEAIAGCTLAVGLSARPREFAGRVLPMREAAASALAHAVAGEVALVFGSETSGLSNDELARCHVVATIPANPDYAALNLAAAVQIACYELWLAASGGGVWQAPRFAPATADQVAALDAHVARTLADMRFLNPGQPRRLMPRLRRLFARAQLEQDEVNILRGILGRIDELLRR